MNKRLFEGNSRSHADEGQSSSSFRLPRWLELSIVVVIVLELIAPFTSSSYGPDGPIHFYWIRCYNDIIRDGVFPPRWIASSFKGFGSPTFYFYPPLSFMIAAVLCMFSGIGNSFFLFQGVTFISTIIGAIGMWVVLGNLDATKYQKILGAFIYSFAPYRIAEIYSRSSLSSIFANGFIPWICLGIIWIFSTQKLISIRGLLAFALSLAAILLSSVPTAILIGISLLFLGIVFLRHITRRGICYLLLTFLLVVLLDAFYLWPLFQYRNAIHLNNGLSDPEFVIIDALHLTGAPGVFHGAIIYSAIALFILIGVASRSKRRIIPNHFYNLTQCAFFLALFILFLDLPISVFLWRHFPFFSLIQGPWRFYTIIVMMISLLVGTPLIEKFQKWTIAILTIWTLGALLPILLIMFNIHIYPHHVTAEDDPATFLPASARASIFSKNRPDLYLPVLGRLPSKQCMIDTEDGSGSDSCEVISSTSNQEMFAVNFSNQHRVIFHRFAWPGWHLYEATQVVQIESDSIGRVVATLPKGNYIVKFLLEPSELEIVGCWTSTFFLIASIGTLILILVQNRKRSRAIS